MSKTTYEEFVEQVNRYRIFPFSDLVAEYPSLTAAAADNEWHTGTELDPWLWRIRIVKDGYAAYGKFFGTKASFVHVDAFPLVKVLLSGGTTVEARYRDGLLSTHAYKLYELIREAGNIDSRQLRKAAKLDAKEQKKEYESALVQLQNFGDIVITGAKESDHDGGWSSMCYETSDYWLEQLEQRPDNDIPEAPSIQQARDQISTGLRELCTTEKSYGYFAKKLKLNA
ncbi:AlkZ-related protein [Paenibacillus harenae]|uniref:Uncharacterized protein n=1 Tax=Paenibacillus harenae TaxID=306543 RepID=A0ABT9U7Q9_PAEHA|nr:hypothetical protein [Paenibacillus harenae]MDQ0115669.1 hypothetical protein [Paenibacillus harenae]